MDFDKYDMKTPRPTRPEGQPVLKGRTAQDHRDYADQLETWEKTRTDWQQRRNAWDIEQNNLEKQFKSDMFHELGIENHPKRETVWDWAWEEHRNDGYAAVYEYAERLVDTWLR
jgi:hypothetical protein